MNEIALDKNHKRPKYLNLLQIRLPITGVVSIGHRVSGVLLFLAIPLMIYLFDRSLHDAASFQQLGGWFSNGFVKLGLLALVLAGVHHVLAGIRFLLVDVGVGESVTSARRAAWLVIAGGVLLFCIAVAVVI